MTAESSKRTLKDVAKERLDIETLIDLYFGFHQILKGKGNTVRIVDARLWDVLFLPWGGNKIRLYKQEIPVNEKTIPLLVFKRESKHWGDVDIDIGMSMNRGERVRLKLRYDTPGQPDAKWVFIDRPSVMAVFGRQSPTPTDLEPFVEALNIVRGLDMSS